MSHRGFKAKDVPWPTGTGEVGNGGLSLCCERVIQMPRSRRREANLNAGKI